MRPNLWLVVYVTLTEWVSSEANKAETIITVIFCVLSSLLWPGKNTDLWTSRRTAVLKYNPMVFISSHIYKQKTPQPAHHLLHITTWQCKSFRQHRLPVPPPCSPIPTPHLPPVLPGSNSGSRWQNQSAHSTFSDWAPRDIQWRDFMAHQWIQKGNEI